MKEIIELLKVGSMGDNVLRLQKALAAMGFNPGKTEGTFDIDTELSVRHLQEAANLQVNGEVDEKTWDVIMKTTWNGTQDPVTLERNPDAPYQRHLLPDVEYTNDNEGEQ
ncbi:MAG TPA: peptidoglycan-binding domain-containing protein [Nitrososphaeraceae archaeon]|nr:peptidoglycan-binding domain-containing protein [Nitrososphaeraceae archaeon]